MFVEMKGLATEGLSRKASVDLNWALGMSRN